MLAIILNENVDAESRGERVVIQSNHKISRTGNLPSEHIHRTIVMN